MSLYTFKALGPLPEISWFEERSIGISSVRRGDGYGSLRRDEAILTIEAESQQALDLAVDELTHRGVSRSLEQETVATVATAAPLHLLDLSVKKLRASLREEALSASALRALLAAEKAGKTRATAVALLEETISDA
tara:strand:- start:772 stop:1179 length:408 start_codon:yes stop_codon:yes gene_type:complete